MNLIVSTALAVLFLVSSNTQATQLTGCLNFGGQLNSVAAAQNPAKPCSSKETLVTFGGAGPQGPPPKERCM